MSATPVATPARFGNAIVRASSDASALDAFKEPCRKKYQAKKTSTITAPRATKSGACANISRREADAVECNVVYNVVYNVY